MSDWYNDHDNWAEQFGEFVEHLRRTEGMDDNDIMFVSNLAAKVKRGDMSIPRAVHEIMHYVAAQMGYIAYPDEEAFRLDMQYHDRLEITEELKANLVMVDEPGIADAIIHAFASLKILDETNEQGQEMADVGIGLHTKGWFHANGMDSKEDTNFKWAVGEALKQRYVRQS